ncbi:right-handed parallel beta-helix repeat-containing protein [Chloroflexota bacterium]
MKRKVLGLMLVLVLVLSFSLATVVLVAAADLEVGSGKTYATITAAVAAATDGDTILVYDGPYIENVIVDKSVSLVSNPGVILDGSGLGGNGFLIQAPDITIDGFEIKNFAIGIRTYGGPSNFGNLDILNCNIHNNTKNGILIVYDTFDTVTVENTTINANTQNGIGIANGATINNLNMLDADVSSNARHGLFLANTNIANVNITDSSFDGAATDGFSGITIGTTASTIGAFSMTGGSLSSNKGAGLSIVQQPSTFDSINLNGVIIQGNRESGAMLGGGASTSSLAITNTVFQNNGSYYEDLDLTGGWFGAFSVTGETNITNNCFLGGAWAAVYVGGAGSFTGDVNINFNYFTTQTWRLANDNAKLINANNNWWGNEVGPAGNQYWGNVDSDPWLATLAYSGETLFSVTDDIVLEATLSNSDGSLELEGAIVDFIIETTTVGTDVTDVNGVASHNLGSKDADVYEVTARAVYAPNGCDFAVETTALVVVYDPSDGFVTGGGWIESPSNGDYQYMGVGGKATFGFVSKYNKKTELAEGNTEFMFKAGNLNFHSNDYEWLVVNKNDSRAQFKGTGTINGEGEFKFMLWASDGEQDTFRIKIWEENGAEVVVYDNGVDQVIGGGSIVVHISKK